MMIDLLVSGLFLVLLGLILWIVKSGHHRLVSWRKRVLRHRGISIRNPFLQPARWMRWQTPPGFWRWIGARHDHLWRRKTWKH